MDERALEPLPEPAAVLPEQLRSVDELAGAFLVFKREPTRSAYRRDLGDFAAFLAATGVRPLSVRRVHVDAYARMLERHGAAPTTMARRLACLAGPLSAF